MSEQHTPGPWKAGPPAWFRGRTDPEHGKRPITAGKHGKVANAWGAANAALIARAPELLAEVRRLREENEQQRKTIERYAQWDAQRQRNVDLAAQLTALRRSHARLLAAIKADADKIMPDETLCWCSDRYYGEHGFYCADLRAAVAEAEAL